MSPRERAQRIEELFRLGVELVPEEREAFLARHAAGDEELAGELRELLRQDQEGTKSYLQSPLLSGWSRSQGDTSRLVSEDAAAAEAFAGARVERIGRYQIERELGQGGMGAVYLARQVEPVRRYVALKIVKLGMDTRRVVARFERERQALALMDHPGIARIYDGGATASGRPYFVMEYVPGVPITEYCDRAELGVRARLELFARACDAVEHAHQRGIVHRDLKPSNVLVAERDGAPAPKVIDFGVARATASVADPLDAEELAERPTRASEVIGTFAYMSPEQADPESTIEVGPRSDVYSLGVLLYELLTGALPLDATDLHRRSPSEVSRLITAADPAPPSTRVTRLGAASAQCARRRGCLGPRALARHLSGDLDWITLMALERDPLRRYASAAALADDVRRHLAHRALRAGPPSRLLRARKFARRHRMGIGAGFVLLLTLASGALGTRLGFRRADAALVREAEERRRVSETCAALFSMVDIAHQESNWRGDESVIAQLLEIAAELAPLFADDPAGEAELRQNLGCELRARGAYAPARAELERARELWHELGADAATLARTERELHRVEVDSAGHENYAAGLRAAGYAVEALHAQAPFVGAAAAELLADARAHELSSLPQDLEALEKSLSGVTTPGARLLAADVLSIAGGYLGLRLAFPEARPLLERSVDLRAAAEGPLHPEVVRDLGELSEHLLQQSTFDAAAELLEERVAIFQAGLPAGHWMTAELASRLGECRSVAGDARALQLLSESKDALGRARGARSQPARAAHLRLRDHFVRSGDPVAAMRIDALLGTDASHSPADDRLLAFGRMARVFGADAESADAIVTLMRAGATADVEGGAGLARAARTLSQALESGALDPKVSALVAMALRGVEARGGDSGELQLLARALARATELATPRLVAPERPAAEHPTLRAQEPAGDPGEPASAPLALAPKAQPEEPPQGFLTPGVKPLPDAPVEAPVLVTSAWPMEPESAEDYLVLAWLAALPDHGDEALYALAIEACAQYASLEPEAPLAAFEVMALAVTRFGAPKLALSGLAWHEEEQGSLGVVGWLSRSLACLELGELGSSGRALGEARLVAVAAPELVPEGAEDLFLELQQKLSTRAEENPRNPEAGTEERRM
jgi:serine/threonine protein kinase